MLDALRDALLVHMRSRKFRMLLLAVIQTLVLHYAHVDPEVWATIDALIVFVMLGTAYEDGQAKRSGNDPRPL